MQEFYIRGLWHIGNMPKVSCDEITNLVHQLVEHEGDSGDSGIIEQSVLSQ